MITLFLIQSAVVILVVVLILHAGLSIGFKVSQYLHVYVFDAFIYLFLCNLCSSFTSR